MRLLSNPLARRVLPLVVVLLATSLPACQTLREVAALRDVSFALRNVADVEFAGVNLTEVRDYSDLGLMDVARLTRALTSRELPLNMIVNVEATNPENNPVAARMVQFDWTLLLDDTETISGVFSDEVALQPGQPTTIGIPVSLNLAEFFDQSLPSLFNLALAVAGQGDAGAQVALRATPTISTPIGPITYPNPIMVVNQQVGRGAQ